MARKKIGLALSSGAARGLAHIGVLEVLEREGIPIDMIAGASAGALVGGMYAYTKDIALLRKWASTLASSKLSFLTQLTPTRTGLIGGKRVENRLRAAMGETKFSDLKIPFACVATDICNGEEVVIKEGPIVEAIRASISIPGLFAVAKYGDKYLVDGGTVDPVPVSVLKEMGADFVIACNVVPDLKDRVCGRNSEPKAATKAPNVFEILIRTVHIAAYQAARFSLAQADIAIEPHVIHIGFGDFHRCEECAIEGKIATEKAIPEIKRRLGI